MVLISWKVRFSKGLSKRFRPGENQTPKNYFQEDISKIQVFLVAKKRFAEMCNSFEKFVLLASVERTHKQICVLYCIFYERV